MTRIGLFGGTFDPIHQGHLDVATAAVRALALARVLVVPCRVPPHRRTPEASAAHRFAMAALAIQATPALVLSDLEMEAPSPSYTSATLDRLVRAGLETAHLFLITGADAFRDIGTWMGFPGLLDRCHFVAVSRPGCPAADLRQALPDLAGRMMDVPLDATAPWPAPDRPTIVLVGADTAPVSSTDIRRRVRNGESITGLVPEAVAAYIARQHLYGGTAASTL